MPDVEALAARITRLANDETLLRRREQATRQAAIDPVLRDLGWDTSNLEEVDPEYDIRSEGRADYSLRHRGDDLVLIEAKKAGESLDAHQDQLLRYAYGVRINLAVLTNGLNWWLYLPRANADWEQRRFLSVGFGKDEPEATQAAADLWRFLSREKVVSGEALKEAETEFNKLERKRRLTGALPTAWSQLLTEPDELLVEILQTKTADIVGSRPDEVDKEAVSDFLLSKLRRENMSPPTAAPTTPSVVRRHEVGRADSPRRKAPGTSPIAFHLDGRSHPVHKWSDLLVAVCNLLIADVGDRFGEHIAALRTSTRFTATGMGNNPRKLANGMYLDANLNADNSERLARNVVRAVRGPQGADSFHIDTR